MIGNKLEPFKFWCQKVLPNVYDDSLSYYEYLCKLNEYLNEVIGQINTLTDNMEDYEADLTATWLETKEYIDNYFNNLDVQQEINNKLDAMAESGELSTLLAPIVGTQIGGVVADQIGATVANQIGDTVASQIGPVVASQIDEPTATATSAWLTEHVDPVGSAVIVDDTLTITGAAADAETVGTEVRDVIGSKYIVVNYNLEDTTVRNTLLSTTSVNAKSVTFHDFNLNVDSEDYVLHLVLADSTQKYVALKNNVTYSYSSNIASVQVYAEANHISAPMVVYGVLNFETGIIKDIIDINNKDKEQDSTINELRQLDNGTLYSFYKEVSDVTVYNRIFLLQNLNITSFIFADFMHNISNNDVAIKIKLNDNNTVYIKAVSGEMYYNATGIKDIEMYADANHLSAPMVFNGILSTGYGIISAISENDKKLSNLADYVGNKYINEFTASNSDIAQAYTYKFVQYLNLPYITAFDIDGTVGTKDVVIAITLQDNSIQYASFRDKTTYRYNQNIKAYRIYVEANHLTELLTIHAIISCDRFISLELGQLNGNINTVQSNLNTKINTVETNQILYSNNVRYKMFTFDSQEKLIILGSNDGIKWFTIKTNAYASDSGSVLRDPSVISYKGIYYMVYSRILDHDDGSGSMYPTSKYIGLAKSENLVNWTQMTSIEFADHHNLWAPEWYKKTDGTYEVLVTAIEDGESDNLVYRIPITSFEPFTYGTPVEIPTSGVSSRFDLYAKNVLNDTYIPYSAGLRLKFAKMVDGIMTQYNASATWLNESLEGPCLIEMNGIYRLYLADHRSSPNTISYSESTDMINWGPIERCILPITSLQHPCILYEDEWIASKFNNLT